MSRMFDGLIFKSGFGLAPPWAELEFFEIIELAPAKKHVCIPLSKNERLFVVNGGCEVLGRTRSVLSRRGQSVRLRHSSTKTIIIGGACPTTLVRVGGHWTAPTGEFGVFTLAASNAPCNAGDPSLYPRNTVFDNHHHDCDEYWIICGGKGTVVVGGQHFDVTTGDCVVTPAGLQHDFPIVQETINGVYFESTLRGQRRTGHLWAHTHGTPTPRVHFSKSNNE